MMSTDTWLAPKWVGAGFSPAPPTPPDMRVRIRRFIAGSDTRTRVL
jgi:hypothetical protein